MALSWVVCQIASGDQVDVLPLTVSGDVERTVGAPSSLSASLAVTDEKCPPNWVHLLDGKRHMIVLDDDGQPLVGYRIGQYETGSPEVPIPLRSLESALDAVNVWTHEFWQRDIEIGGSEPGTDEAEVAAIILRDVLAAPLTTPGSWGFTLDVTPTGRTADHTYAAEEDRTVLSVLNELMAAEGGPEWTIRYSWSDDVPRRLIKTIHIAPIIGSTIESTVIESHHLASRKRKVSFEGDNLATHVIAVSDGSGLDRPTSDPFVDQDALDAGVPRVEARIHVSGVDDTGLLNRVGEAGLRRRWDGLTTWDLTLAATAVGCPRVGRDFDAGDTVPVQIDPVILTDGRVVDPGSWYGMARIIGWRAQIGDGIFKTVTPVFWEDRDLGVPRT